MRIPKVPSLLHFARFASKDVKKIEADLRRMAERPPRINYLPSKKGAWDHVVLGVSAAQVLGAVERIKGERQRNVNLAALTAFMTLAPALVGRNFAEVEVKYYPIGRKLFVPVNPFLYTSGRDIQSLLWPSFWKNLTLKEYQLAVYATILDLMFFHSPDYAGCSLELADLGCLPGEDIRKPHFIRRSDLPTMTTRELKEYTDPFVETFLKLVAEIRGSAEKSKKPEARSEAPQDWYLDQPPPK